MYTGEGDNETLSVIGLIIFILMIAVDVTVLFGTENDLKKYEMKANLEAMRLQEKFNTETIRQMEDSQKELAKQTHDFKNHLIAIEEMIKTQRSKEDLVAADDYVQSLVQGIDKINGVEKVNIKNSALRAIVRRLEHDCLEYGIEMKTDIQYSDFSFMLYQDICSFFTNAFDNALWACQQIRPESSVNKIIAVNITKRNGYVRIKIANSNIIPILKNKRWFLSQKNEAARAGIGTQNMRKSIEQYGGTWTSPVTFLPSLPLSPSQPDKPNIR